MGEGQKGGMKPPRGGRAGFMPVSYLWSTRGFIPGFMPGFIPIAKPLVSGSHTWFHAWFHAWFHTPRKGVGFMPVSCRTSAPGWFHASLFALAHITNIIATPTKG